MVFLKSVCLSKVNGSLMSTVTAFGTKTTFGRNLALKVINLSPAIGDGDGKTDIGIFGPVWAGDPRAIAHEPGLPDPDNLRLGKMKNVPPEPDEATEGVRAMRRTARGKVRTDLIDHVFHYGKAGDSPVAGDWNGDGITTIGIFRGGVWFIDTNGDGRYTEADGTIDFGQGGRHPRRRRLERATASTTSLSSAQERGSSTVTATGNKQPKTVSSNSATLAIYLPPATGTATASTTPQPTTQEATLCYSAETPADFVWPNSGFRWMQYPVVFSEESVTPTRWVSFLYRRLQVRLSSAATR